ncbi:MAG: arginyltransferase [Magnetococcales bacterium]|nr:arginyltransferase [Magnetococcales bacterium]MBF0262508.1 arginyltransferase [Magnetococcales bacterium]
MTEPLPIENSHRPLELILSPPHMCGYLTGPVASTLYVNPEFAMEMARYDFLLATGFRRSGNLVYRPWCRECDACVPVRIRVREFVTSTSMRRVIRRNRDLEVQSGRPVFSDEHFALYRRYINSRHGDGPMADPELEEFMEFLHSDWCAVRFADFRVQRRLVMSAVYDVTGTSLSAVYTFFDPQERARGLGTLAILWEVELARQLGLDWVYLGYWIDNCPKMRYKSRFQPLEAYINRRWIPMPDASE